MLVENWCEMNQSCTIFVKESEWLDTCQYLFKHSDSISGVALFPYDNTKYHLPPYEDITEEEYNVMAKAMPTIDFSMLSSYEDRDNTEGMKTLACSGNACEI
jgi:hypothetical protein